MTDVSTVIGLVGAICGSAIIYAAELKYEDQLLRVENPATEHAQRDTSLHVANLYYPFILPMIMIAVLSHKVIPCLLFDRASSKFLGSMLSLLKHVFLA